MEYQEVVQAALDNIDAHLTCGIGLDELAGAVGYSTYHFCRIFAELTGMPVMGYVTRRRMEHAMYELARGRRIIDVALEHGFDSHAGFTRAFKRCFGFAPSLCHLRITPLELKRITPQGVKRRYAYMDTMQPHLTELTPFTVVGRTMKIKASDVRRHADIPALCYSREFERSGDDLLEGVLECLPKSDAMKHCEISMCYDFDPDEGSFTYMLGRGAFCQDELAKLPSDLTRVEISGLYAAFSTPLVPFEQHDRYAQTIRDTWNAILTQWLPASEFEYDDARRDFEYYDYRDHGRYFGNRCQMDIYIPVRQREDARRSSEERGRILWEQEMKRREEL